MKPNIITFAGVGFLVLSAVVFVSIFEIKLASAQVDASSSIPVTTDTATTSQVLITSTSTARTQDDMPPSTSLSDASSSETIATSTSASPAPTVEQPPKGLTEVHIIGTKYVDYFTDGTTVTSYPGDPTIDAHLAEPDAPIPTHEGLTWDQTMGYNLYDTSSGDLEVGDYAVRSDGSIIADAPPFVSSTSTAPAMNSSASIGTASSTTPPSNTGLPDAAATFTTGSSTTQATETDATTTQ
jgi:hypothetical protein